MRTVAADFARQRTPSAGWWWLCAVLLATCLALTVLTLQSRQRAHLLSQQADETEAQVRFAREALQRPKPPAPPPYEASAREMLAAHSVPWPTLLAALEATAVPGVRVVTLDYDAARATSRVEFAFDRPANMLKLLDELNAGSAGAGPAWRWHVQEMDQRNGAELGRAILEARWSKVTQ